MARLDLGFGNPNKTACLLAECAVACWCAAYARRKLFWLSAVTALGFALGVVLTGSRGGLLSLCLGTAGALFGLRRKIGAVEVVALCIAGCIVVGSFFFVRPAARILADPRSDLSVLNRWLIWKQVPRMMVDAPGGWGFGASGDAFMQWYQDPERPEVYRTLVSSHLTWLVEGGWLFRFGYLLFWTAALLVPITLVATPACYIAFGVWLAFGSAAIFSSVAEAPSLWIIPGLFLVVAAVGGKAVMHVRRKLSAAFCISLAGLIALYIAGQASARPLEVHKLSNRVTVGPSPPRYWLVNPNKEVLGRHFGHAFRTYLNSQAVNSTEFSAGLGVVNNVEALRHIDASNVILVNASAQELYELQDVKRSFQQLFLFNTSPVVAGFAARIFPNAQVFGILGERSSQAVLREVEDRNSHRRNLHIFPVEGCADYIPDWTFELDRASHSREKAVSD